MEEIHSFNVLFYETERAKFKIESFHQDDAGFFYAAWRSADNVIGPELKRRAPFTCMLDAFLAARDKFKTEEPEQTNDLFG